MTYRCILGGALAVIALLSLVAAQQDQRITQLEAAMQSLQFQANQPVEFTPEAKVAVHRCVTDSECEGLVEF